MKQLIESSADLRKRLHSEIARIKELDPLPHERRKTGGKKRRLLATYGDKCGYCDSYEPLDAAHIVPLEIGGKTEEKNLILLCKGCHNHYDDGHLSISEMSKIAKCWRKGLKDRVIHPPLCPREHTSPTIAPPPRSVYKAFQTILQYKRERKFAKAVLLTEQLLRDSGLSDDARQYLRIKRAELTRRRAMRGAVELARCYIEEIDPVHVPLDYHSVFYYELSYIYHLAGDHQLAAKAARQSAENSLADNQSPGVDWVAAEVEAILCDVASLHDLSQKRTRQLVSQLQTFEKVAAAYGGNWGGLWAFNCKIHALRIRIKALDAIGSWQTLEELRNAFFCLDTTSGWDAGGRQTVSMLDGLVHVLFSKENEDLNHGIGLLARSLLTRVGGLQRPEGVRDVGFGLATGLRKKGSKEWIRTAELIEEVMTETMDGISILWPWRAFASQE